MIRFTLITICILVESISVFSQGDFFYVRGGKTPVIPFTDRINVKFKDNITVNEVSRLTAAEPDLGEIKYTEMGFTKIKLKKHVDVGALLKRLGSRPEIVRVNPVFVNNNEEVLYEDRFIVQFKPSVRFEEIEALSVKYGVVITKEISKNFFVFETPDSGASHPEGCMNSKKT